MEKIGEFFKKQFEGLVRLSDVAKMLNLSQKTCRRNDADGLLPEPVIIGKSKLWRKDELLQWIKAGCPDRQRWEEMKKNCNTCPDTASEFEDVTKIIQTDTEEQKKCNDCEKIKKQFRLIENLRARTQIEEVKFRGMLKINRSSWDKIMTTGEEA